MSESESTVAAHSDIAAIYTHTVTLPGCLVVSVFIGRGILDENIYAGEEYVDS